VTPTKSAILAAEVAGRTFGSLHSLVALYLVDSTPGTVHAVSALPLQSILSAARTLLDYNICHPTQTGVWARGAPKPDGRAPIWKEVASDVFESAGRLGKNNQRRVAANTFKRCAPRKYRRQGRT